MNKPTLIFADVGNNLRAICPACGALALEIEQSDAPYVKCRVCNYQSALANFTIRHQFALSSLDDDEPESESDSIESYANIDFGFDESLVPDGLFREVFEYFRHEADAPPQFIFTTTLAMLMSIVGTRLSLTCGALKIKTNDYFVLLTKSGHGKSTSLEACRALLSELEKKIVKNTYHNIFLFPQATTLRGILDCLREESETEMRAREIMEQKGKPTPPPKQAQRSGVAIVDEISALFDATKNDFNSGLDATILLLWDGNPRIIATSVKNDGKMRFEDSALTLLCASTPKKFVERLPKGAFLDGMIPRFQFVFAENRKKPRTALTALTKSHANCNEIVAKLLDFFMFVCEQSGKPLNISDEAKALDEQSVRAWYNESLRLDDETADGYMQRIDMRKLRYALLLSVLECYNRHGRFADSITISGNAMQKAIDVCNFYKMHTLHFIVKSKALKPKAPNETDPLPVRVRNKIIELNGYADKRTIQRALSLTKEKLDEALKPLIETNQIVITQRQGTNGRFIAVLTIPKKQPKGSDTSDTSDTSQKSFSLTSHEPKNALKCQKMKCQSGSDTLSSDTSMPAPEAPAPAAAPEEKAMPKVEPATDQMSTDVVTSEPITPLTVEPTKLREALRKVITETLKNSERPTAPPPKPAPAAPTATAKPESEAKPETPPNTEASPKPTANLSLPDLAEIVLDNLRRRFACKKIPASEIRKVLNNICKERADLVGHAIYPKYILRLEKTNFFVFRQNELRPLEYQGLVPDSSGVLPDDPMPF